jgi:hypothetical protein
VSEVLSSLNVAPLYGQVVVECEGASDLPVPETGQERVVATTQSLLIATRGDQDGDVLIEVHCGQDSNDFGEQVFDGELSFTSPRLVFGSSLAGELASAELDRTGWVPIKVYVQPVESPSRVVVVVSDP